jgi:N4-gp56 family major capsid protein
MATSTFPATGGFVDNTSAATFIPEIWSDEIIAAYKTNLVLAPLVKKMSMKGKKGDTIHIPAPTRGVASAKVENTAVTVQNAVESEVIVTINKHFEYSRIIEDITETQALSSLRQFYTGDAGYALAKQVDDDLFALGQYFGNGSGSWVHNNSFFCDASTGLTAYAEDTVAPADVFTDACFRALIQQMDDLDVPMDNRSFVMPPSLRNAITGIDRYVSSDFVDGRAVTNGKLGNLYGIDLFVTSNCPIVETAAANSANTGNVRGALLIHKDACVLAEQVGIRSQTQYKQEFLGTLYTADTLYGTKVVRPESGLVLVVNN